MKQSLKILFISQEIKPYLPETEISNVCREFPQYIQEQGCEIRTFMPCYGHINELRNQLHEVQRLSGMNLILDDTDHPITIKVASIQSARMQIYFIDNEDYFSKKGIATDKDGVPFEDNDERAIFYVRGVMETVKKLRWTPDVICCNGWISAIAPLYIKKVYNSDPFFEKSKVIYYIYENSFEGNFRDGLDEKIMIEGVEPQDITAIANKVVTCDDLNRLAIDHSDAIILGSETINEDLVRYTKEKGIPYLPYEDRGEEYKGAYAEFIDSLFNSKGDL